MRSHSKPSLLWAVCVVVFAGFTVAASGLKAQSSDAAVSCNEFLVSRVEVKGKQVGQESCQMTESELTFQGRQFRRMEMGISGTVAGYTLKDESARYANYLNQYPEIVYPQAGVDAPFYHGIGRYEAAQGTSVTLMYPLDRSAWNGKMYVTAHGAGRSFKYATLKAWNQNLDPADPLSDVSKYEELMLEKGYAVAKTRRTTLMTGGDLIVTLDDGTVVRDRNLTEQPSFIMGLAKLAENVLERRLGRMPSRTYWYGHSGGARPGRMVNYKAGLNVDTDGTPIIDGIIADDAGAGLWVPAVFKDGKDVLFATAEDQRRFVPQIDITHLLYVNETPDDPPSFRGYNNFTASKRINARLLRDKGLGSLHRVYEIAGISHSGGEYLEDGKDGDVEILDMSRIMDGLIDILDNWVENGVAPPPSKSEWAELGDADGDGILENGPVALPEVACPLGVYHIFPPSRGPRGQGTTGFAAFTGEGLEPEDGRGHVATGGNVINTVHSFVDMNQNGYRDFRETVTQAWLRLGLLEPREKFSRDKYAACVQQAVESLQEEGFITSEVADFYLQQAATMPLPDN